MAASNTAVQPSRIMTDAELQAANERKMMETVAKRASFYRANPHRFAKDYLHLDLYIFQQIILVLISLSTNFLFLASRGYIWPRRLVIGGQQTGKIGERLALASRHRGNSANQSALSTVTHRD